MNQDQLEGKWKQLKGSVRQKFGQLTDNDVEQINGSTEKFIGRLQERYGYTREKAQKELEEFQRASGGGAHQQQAPPPPKTHTGGGGQH